MASPLELILERLLEPDNDIIQKATQDLKEAFKEPTSLQSLCQILTTSQKPQVRQYSAVLIRRKIHKSKQWASLSDEIKQSIRDNILQLLIQEQEKICRSSIAQIIGVVARHDTPTGQWPALFEFLVSYVKSEEPAKREIGMYVLSTVTSIAAEQMKPHMVSLLELLAASLNDCATEVAFLSIKSMTDLVFYIGDAELKYVQNVVPKVIEVVESLAKVDEDKACVALEFFDELLESEVSIIVPHLKVVMTYCLQIASNKELGDALRVKAMAFVSALVRLKKKTVLKHHLMEPILQVLFPIICEDEEEDEDEEEELETQKPSHYAVQVVDTMALHLPPQKFLSKLTPGVEALLKSPEAPHRRAAYLVMAVIVEGCADYVMNKMLSDMLKTACQGLNDSAVIVRNSALFAIGQFSEHLQPDISKFAPDLLPVLFQYLNKSMQDMDTNPKGVVKSHYALEMFCENLGEGIMPYLPQLMEYLLNVLHNCQQYKPKELAISAIGAAASAAKAKMQPYFNDVLALFKVYLMSASEEEHMKKLQLATIDTLAVFARSIGEETFRPLSKECIEWGLNLLQSSEDPDLRRCVYGLFSAIATILKAEMAEYLQRIVDFMFKSITSTEGVKAHYKDESDSVMVFNEEEFRDGENDIEADDEETDYKIEGISVENAYLDEKEDACCSLGDLAINTGSVFMPYLQTSYTEVLNLIEYPAPGIKKGAMTAVGQFCQCVHTAHKETQAVEAEEMLKAMIVGVIPKYLDIIQTDLDRTVVMTGVDSIQEMLEKIGTPVLAISGATDAILTVMKEIFAHKMACQDQEEEEDEENEAEFDSMLIESAGDVLPVMARLMGGESFLPFFTSFVTDLMKRLKETSSTAEKSFAVGTLAEVIDACGTPVGSQFIGTLYPAFTKMTGDEDEEVRSNAIYALGVLAVNGGDTMIGHFPNILQLLFQVISKEANPRVQDNVCAAVCRMLWHSQPNVPVPQVMPAVMQLLPLKEDLEEYGTVFACLFKLYAEKNPEILPHIPKILQVAAIAMNEEEVKAETQAQLVEFVKSVKQNFPTEFDQVASSLEPELALKLSSCL